MSNYDDYITGADKPFAENINDALLLSNVFDLTVPIQAPNMFRDSSWIDTTSRRKCGVAILTLKEALPSGVSVSTVDGQSVLTGTGTVKLGFYPNFNSFGRFKSISWEDIGTVQVNLKTVNNTTILSNIPKGIIENPSGELRKLQEIVIEIVLNNSTLKSLDVVMVNKESERYGAEVGIDDVNGLEDILNGKANANHTHIKSQITDFSHNHDERYYTETEMDNKLNWKKHYWFDNVDNIDLYYNDLFYCLELNGYHYYGYVESGNYNTGIRVPTGTEPSVGVQTDSVGGRYISFYVTSSGYLGITNKGNAVDGVTLRGTLIWRRV